MKGPRYEWTEAEIKDLPEWFKEHQHLSPDEIEREYYRVSLKARTYPSLQSRLYKDGFKDLCNKRKKVSQESATPKSPSPALAPLIAKEANHAQLSLAMRFISNSFSSLLEHSLPPEAPEIGRESEKLLSQIALRSNSRSQGANNECERTAESELPATNVTKPDICGNDDVNKDFMEDANETIIQSEEFSANIPPIAKFQPSDCGFIAAQEPIPGENESRTFENRKICSLVVEAAYRAL